MKSVSGLASCVFVLLVSCLAAQAQGGAGTTLVNDALRDRTVGAPEGAGEFITGGGWRSRGGLIVYDVGRYIEHGSFEARVWGYRSPAGGVEKSHLLAGWELPVLDQGGENTGAWWTWRIGTGSRPFKLYAARDGGKTRREFHVEWPDLSRINDDRPHVYRVVWNKGQTEYFFDGESLGHIAHARQRLRYFTIGRDKSYQITDPAPIIADVKITDHGTAPPAEPKVETEVARYGMFEKTLAHGGRYANPYREVEATATVTRHGGETYTVPLFWDGGRNWKLRFSPDAPGWWGWKITSNDAGLNNQTGAFQCAPSANRGGIQPWHAVMMQHQDGTLFHLMGDTNWAALQSDPQARLDREAIRRYADARGAQGFNFVQTNLLGRGLNEGGAAFNDYASEQINPAYWQEVDSRLAYLNGKNLTVMLTLAWGGPNEANFKTWADFPDTEARRRYARYVAARYGAYNVCFNVAGEWNLTDDGPAQEKLMKDLGQHLSASDAHRRMIAIHPAPGGRDGGSVKRFAGERWMAFEDYKQDYDDIHQDVVAAWRRQKPIINAGYGVYRSDGKGSGKGLTLDEMRHATWDILMGYGYFVTGFGGTHQGDARAPGLFVVDVAQEKEWADDLRHIRKLFFDELGGAGQPWRLYTHDDLISSPAGRGSDLHEPKTIEKKNRYFPRAHWARAVIHRGEGQKYLVYMRGWAGEHKLSLGTHRLNPDGVPGGTYTVRRFDPRTGEYVQLPDYKGKGPIALTTPDDRDWAFMLVLKRQPDKDAAESDEPTTTSREEQ